VGFISLDRSGWTPQVDIQSLRFYWHWLLPLLLFVFFSAAAAAVADHLVL